MRRVVRVEGGCREHLAADHGEAVSLASKQGRAARGANFTMRDGGVDRRALVEEQAGDSEATEKHSKEGRFHDRRGSVCKIQVTHERPLKKWQRCLVLMRRDPRPWVQEVVA